MRNPSHYAAKQKRRVENWNKEVEIGTDVIVRLDDGTRKATVTTGEAFLLNETGVIYLEGISGCYLLDRVSVNHKIIPMEEL